MAVAIPPLPEMIRTPADREAVRQGCYFDLAAAERVYTFFARFLRHSVGRGFAGTPFTLLPWQWEDVIAPIFGWKRKDGTRRYREAYIEIPKKNGKSTLSAAIALYLLLADGEPAAEVYSAAADRDQASIVYNEAVRMVNASAALQSKLWPTPSKRMLTYPKTGSTYRVLSSEAHTKEGYNIHGLIFDEFHAQPSPDLYDTLKYGGAARQQPLFVYITTAGYDRESVCWSKHCYAERVLSGEVTDIEFFAYIKAASPEDEWKDKAVWYKANPSLGVTVPLEHMERMAKVASESPLEENTFKRYHLNLWTEQKVRWVPIDKWDACEGKTATEGHCYAGLDLAATRDINAFVLFFPETHFVLPFFWVPEAALADRIRMKRTKLDAWVEQGLIRVTPGNAADYDVIESDILEIASQYSIRKTGIDKWNSLQLANHLMDEGMEIAAVGQGYASLSGPTKMLERMVVNEVIRHDGNPVLRWMFGNVAVKQDPAGNIKPDKSKVADKIDGIVALLMALAAWQVDEGPSVYEKQGVEYL